MYLNLFLFSVLLVYASLCLLFWLKWELWEPFEASQTKEQGPFVSVLIPVRNEERHIAHLLQSLAKQSLPTSRFEVLVLNDESTDGTTEIVQQFIDNSPLNIHCICLKGQNRSLSPKKRAITKGIERARGEIIVCIDGDCFMGRFWLEEIVHFFADTQAVFVSAPVFIEGVRNETPLKSFFTAVQQIEFGSLILSGAVSIQMKHPNMCSGANMAYHKSAFEAVNGFEGNLHVASGDDEFLMHKMHLRFPGKVRYLKSKRATVFTQPLPNLGQFYQQRKRWASKWASYEHIAPKLLALFIFTSNLAFILALFTSNWPLILLKVVPEALFLSSLRFFTTKNRIFLSIPILQIIYPFYVVFFGLGSLQKKEYIWKNRELK